MEKFKPKDLKNGKPVLMTGFGEVIIEEDLGWAVVYSINGVKYKERKLRELGKFLFLHKGTKIILGDIPRETLEKIENNETIVYRKYYDEKTPEKITLAVAIKVLEDGEFYKRGTVKELLNSGEIVRNPFCEYAMEKSKL